MLKFSIIVPVYNVEAYLDECIQSVLEQTYTDFELILVDDGSKDSSGTLCDQWAQRDSRVNVIHINNGGASTARNEALRHITGQYVMFLDSDDYWLSCDVLQQIAQRLDRTAADVLIFNLRKVYDCKQDEPYFDEGVQLYSDLGSEKVIELIVRNGLWTACAWNKAVRSELFEEGKLRFVEGVTSEDVDWCMRLSQVANRIDYLGICVVGYRQRISSVTGKVTVKKVHCLRDNVRTCLELLAESGQEKRMLQQPYIAFQYGVLLHNIAALPKGEEKRKLIAEARAWAYILNWSTSGKIGLLRKVDHILGFDCVLWLLACRSTLVSLLAKRSD